MKEYTVELALEKGTAEELLPKLQNYITDSESWGESISCSPWVKSKEGSGIVAFITKITITLGHPDFFVGHWVEKLMSQNYLSFDHIRMYALQVNTIRFRRPSLIQRSFCVRHDVTWHKGHRIENFL